MKAETCLVCHSSDLNVYFRLKSNGLVALKCGRCGHVCIENSPITTENVSGFYTMNDFRGRRKLQSLTWYREYYDDCLADYEHRLRTSLVLQQFQDKARYVGSKFPNGGRLLDVGCATGVFLDMMRKRGWEVEGVEISNELADYARMTFSVRVHVGDLTSGLLESEPFDVITLFDVIEHIPDPNPVVAACKELLVEDGLLLLRTPTEEGFLRSIAKAIFWMTKNRIEFPMLWFYSYEHIHSFSVFTLGKMIRKHGFAILEVFREEESLERSNIPGYGKIIIQGLNFVSALLDRQHKITVVASKC
jgi:2-polyprenyl-3-methyl-5-hydroxy-6-metoxy-1,4-benzoquinol methylase